MLEYSGEYAGVLRKSSLNQVTENKWSIPLVNQVSDSKKDKSWLYCDCLNNMDVFKFMEGTVGVVVG